MTALDRPTLSAQLAPIRARADAATLADEMWRSENFDSKNESRYFTQADLRQLAEEARTDVPALLAIIARLTDALDVAEKAVKQVSESRYSVATWEDGSNSYSISEEKVLSALADYDAAKEAMGHE